MSDQKKTAIVTGSTSGIGHGIAEAFASQGINVMLNGFGDAAEIEKTRSAMETKFKVKVTYSAADMSKPADIRQMVTDTVAQHGSVDLRVNNAGIQFVADVIDFPEDRWDQIIAINLSSAFHASKAALPFMKKAGWGRIINIASAHGLVGSAGKSAYVAAKHGIVGLTKVIALEHANDGITANAICPGWVLTPLVEKQINDRAKENGTTFDQEKIKLLSEKQPMHSFVTTQQLGGLALFLVSDAAATITGTHQSIDGGWTAE
jgi:3-hydroxybutyrate dehydrogenase